MSKYIMSYTADGLRLYSLSSCPHCGAGIATERHYHPTRMEGMDGAFKYATEELGAEQREPEDIPPALSYHIHTDTSCPGHEEP